MALPTPFRFGAALTTSFTDIFTVPAGRYAEISLIQIPNIDGVNSVDVTLQWVTSGAVATSLLVLGALAAKDAISPVGAGLLLTAGDKLQARASANSDAVITVCGFFKDIPA